MKISRLKMNCNRALAVTSAVMILAGATTELQANKLTARPLTPQEIHDNSLDAIASGGLMTVGLEEPVYLEALVDEGTVITGTVMWYITSAPSTSAAVLEDSPTVGLEIYSPALRDVYDVAGRKMLVPDVAGSYHVEVVIPTDAGSVELSTWVTGARYVGSGVVNDPAWGGPYVYQGQCAACHAWDADDKVTSFMGTGHATFIEEAVDGIKSSHYSENCIDCHVVGGHNLAADNGNFANAAASAGWTWPTVLQPGNWAAMPLEVKAKANIQCEHCHGAGSEHFSRTLQNQTSISLSSGDCGQCHDEEPYHNKNRQWDISGHSRNPARTSSGCADCHTGEGFINRFNAGSPALPIEGEAIVCAACHDPHSNADDNHQLRNTGDITLENGHVVTMGGNGKFCMNCHKARRDADVYVEGSMSSHFGPHYGVQGDLFNGTNAIEYDGKVVGNPSVHMYSVEDSCAGCHMQTIANSDPAKDLVGEHTFKMKWDPNNTPDDHHDDVAKTDVCVKCHGPMDSFNTPRYDYNLDGITEGLQTEVHHLLDALAMKLPPVGQPTVNRSASHNWTLAEKKAVYNYMCVEEDHSFGVHNPRYITEILKASIEDLGDPLNSVLGGINVPVGGAWFYSPWFDFYSPLAIPGWIYHVTHGYIHVDKDANGNLLVWDSNLDKWLYTNADLYPIMLDVENGTWMYFQGKFGDMRYFYNYGTGNWDIVE